jgi:redox-sensitive bicupin YhaK (pirin superfamily)
MGWLDSWHTFSFGGHHDPAHVGFRALRVINDDRVTAGAGFPTHGHRDMEIVSYVLEGALAHRDSMGNGSVMRPGDVQRMSAGTGVMHSEMNPDAENGARFLQIWILPEARGLAPSYEQKTFDEGDKRGKLRLVASPDAAEGSVTIHADARLYAGLFDGEEAAEVQLASGRKGYVHLVRGELEVNGRELKGGDAALLDDETTVRLRKGRGAEVLVFDLEP